MATGVVKWFNDKKGFGFIQREDGEKDVFVHYSVISEEGYKSLTQGQLVEYSFVQGPKGPLATEVRKLQQEAYNHKTMPHYGAFFCPLLFARFEKHDSAYRKEDYITYPNGKQGRKLFIVAERLACPENHKIQEADYHAQAKPH